MRDTRAIGTIAVGAPHTRRPTTIEGLRWTISEPKRNFERTTVGANARKVRIRRACTGSKLPQSS
jgi:hypothetical protein